ncbi:O-antigen polymerase [Pedobacter antarcticus]|uniref:O-antigen polymerase n=1 Tax=Pedobacter antarcticus TaxID=34086 RepID=UPI00088AB789|nr:O-antigen polymerase [Pedobacter antarcticus]SDM17290.1 oligosaccharide repeat unit polymerase [Pedobacter antarcticus]
MRYKNLLAYLILVSVFICIFIPNLNEPMDTGKNFAYSFISIISIALYLFTFIKLYPTWVRFETLFLIGYLIVHFQIPFLFSFGIEPSNPSFVWLNKEVVNYATWLSSFSIHLWMIGSTLSTISNSKRVKNKLNPIRSAYSIKKLDNILLISFIGFYGLAGGSLLNGSHDGMGSWGEGASYFMIILRVSLYFRIFVFFKELKRVTISSILIGNIMFLSILLLYTLTFMLIGDRGPFMQVVIVIMLCFGVFVKRISLGSLLFLICTGALLLSVIGLGRSVEDGNIFEAGLEKLQNSETNPTEELATSVRIMYRALTYFPSNIDYMYGLQFIIGFLGLIPFASGLFIQFYNIPTEFTASSRLFTYIGQGNNITYGEGTEIISDIYINFGIFGVFLIMFFYGYFTSKVSFNALQKHSDKYFLILIVITSTAIYINRAQFLMPLRDIVYLLVICYFVEYKGFKKRLISS